MTTIGLVMIVKNEESVIERALRSAIPFISSWVIVDTGSTDNTKEIIQSVMSDIPGLLIERPWVSFGTNRSEALSFCDNRMDWAIMLDADDTMEGTVPPKEIWANAQIDAFMLHIKHGTITHNRLQIFRTGIGWGYKGVIHEYAECSSKEKAIVAVLPDSTYMMTRCEGYRSSDPNKYLNDALLLEKELLTHPNDHRILFYLAQSYRDAGHRDAATRYYRQYIDTSGGWVQERYLAYTNLILLLADSDQDEKFRLTWAAIEICPNRLEAPYNMLRQRRILQLPPTTQCYAIARAIMNRKPCMGDMFAIPVIYEWGMDDELAVVAFGTKHFRESYEASMRCVMNAPPEFQINALSNARLAVQLMSG